MLIQTVSTGESALSTKIKLDGSGDVEIPSGNLNMNNNSITNVSALSTSGAVQMTSGPFQHAGSSFQVQGVGPVQIQNTGSCAITPQGSLTLSGHTNTGEVNMSNNKITSLATPTQSTDAATKQYVDDNTGVGPFTPNKIMKSDAAGDLVVSQMSCVEDKNNNENWILESTNPNITLTNSAAGSSQYGISSGGVTSAVQGSATDMRLSHAGGSQLIISPTEVKLGNQFNANDKPLINVSRVNMSSTNVAVGSTAADLDINIGTTAIGAEALNAYTSNVIGSNTALGYQAGLTFDGSGDSTFIGHLAGISKVSGAQSTYVGAQTFDTTTNSNNQTVIGAGALGDASNQVVLGNTAVTQIINSGTATCDLGAPSHEFKDLYMTGVAYVSGMDVGTGSIVNMADPTNPQDAATKAYVDAQTGGSPAKTQNISDTQTAPGITKINDLTSTNSLYLRDEGLSTWDPTSGVGAAGTPVFDRSVLTCQSSANGVKFIPATDAFTFGDTLSWEFNISGATTANNLYLGFVGNSTPNNGLVNFCGLRADGTIYNNGSSVGGSGAAVWQNGGTIKFLIQGNIWSTEVNGVPIAPSYTVPGSLNFRPCLITDVADPAITTYECTIYDSNTVVAEVLGVLEMGGEIEMNDYRITNLGAPLNATDAANRDYVDNAVAQQTSKTQNIDDVGTVPGTTQINGIITTANIQAIGVPSQSITMDGSTLAINNGGATAQITDIGLVDITTPASIIMNADSIIDLDINTATRARVQMDGNNGSIVMTGQEGFVSIDNNGVSLKTDATLGASTAYVNVDGNSVVLSGGTIVLSGNLTGNTGLRTFWPVVFGSNVGVTATRYLAYSGRPNAGNTSNIGVLNVHLIPAACYIIGFGIVRENASSNTTFTIHVETGVGTGVYTPVDLATVSAGNQLEYGQPPVAINLIAGIRLATSVTSLSANPQNCSFTLYFSFEGVLGQLPATFAIPPINDMQGSPSDSDRIQALEDRLNLLTSS